MDYKKIYNQLIQKRLDNKLYKNQGIYLELHHIVPTSLGGSNDQQNKINLTAREHYIAHLLLYKMQIDNIAKFKMFKALVCFKSQNNQKGKSRLEDCKINSRLYEAIRINTFKNFHPKNKAKGKLKIKNIETGKIDYITSFDKLPAGYEYVAKNIVEYNGQMMHYIDYENIIFNNAPNKIRHILFVKRLNNGWTLEEATTIDTKFGANKQNYISYLDALQKKHQKRKFIEDAYNDFKTLSTEEFNTKYSKKQKHYLLKHFRRFPDYISQKHSTTHTAIEIDGVVKNTTQWIKFYKIHRKYVYANIHAGMTHKDAILAACKLIHGDQFRGPSKKLPVTGE